MLEFITTLVTAASAIALLLLLSVMLILLAARIIAGLLKRPMRPAALVGRRRRLRVGLSALLLLLLCHILIVRPWYMSWGAGEREIAMRMTVDSLIPAGATVSTRALTIDAPPSVVWKWVVQLGQGRGGFYSYEWLENLFAAEMRNAERIDPALQQLRVGDTISYKEDGPFGRVTHIVPEREMVVGNGWEWYLAPLDDGNRTRLVVRYPFDYSGSTPLALFYFTTFEPAHFLMESGMMMGIKVRSERSMIATTTGSNDPSRSIQ
jgi:hypothetical protein